MPLRVPGRQGGVGADSPLTLSRRKRRKRCGDSIRSNWALRAGATWRPSRTCGKPPLSSSRPPTGSWLEPLRREGVSVGRLGGPGAPRQEGSGLAAGEESRLCGGGHAARPGRLGRSPAAFPPRPASKEAGGRGRGSAEGAPGAGRQGRCAEQLRSGPPGLGFPKLPRPPSPPVTAAAGELWGQGLAGRPLAHCSLCRQTGPS